MFLAVMVSGVGDPLKMAGGIGEALVCTAAGLCVAIPAYVFHRYFRGRVAELRRRHGAAGDPADRRTDASAANVGTPRRACAPGAAPARAAARDRVRIGCRRAASDDFEINVISLIDVLLTLLMFFVLTTTFVQHSRMKVTLPQARIGRAGRAAATR